MSQMDSLLARSRSPGAFVERTRFTLSREKAIEKQREFALRHPRQYVLELVQAAVFAGATYMAIDVRDNSLLVAWVGSPALESRQLENLLDYLFADRSDPSVRHLVQMAVAVNAILQRKPKVLRIESGDGNSSVRLDIDKSGNGTVGTVETPVSGTYLYAEFSGGWFSRFMGSKGEDERELVETRCLYTPVPILLNGAAPFGYRSSRNIEIFGAKHQETFDDGGRRGAVAVHTVRGAPTGFRIVIGGVWVTTNPLAEMATEPLLGVLCDDSLRKTADHSDVVQDNRFLGLMHEVQPIATRVLREVHPAYTPPKLPPLLEEVATAPQAGPKVTAEPLPDRLPMLGARPEVTVESLDLTGDRPLFYVEPEAVVEVGTDVTDPSRFPWPILILSAGQVLTLADQLPTRPLHRLTSRADVDFVARATEREGRKRSIVVPLADGTLTLTLHDGDWYPDWGHGRQGVPWAAVYKRTTIAYGVVESTRLTHIFGEEEGRIQDLPDAVALPGMSLLFEPEKKTTGFNPGHLEAAQNAAWRLALPEGGEPNPALLAALLGALAVPQLREGPQIAAALPEGWPESIRDAPLTDCGLTLHRFLALFNEDRTHAVADRSCLLRMAPLEERFGHGRLTHPSINRTPVCGVGMLANQWMWIDKPNQWSAAFTQLLWVGASFEPVRSDDRWNEVERPAPELVAAVAEGVEPSALEEGWNLLLNRLQDVLDHRTWGRLARADVRPERVEGMIKLALGHLARIHGNEELPYTRPSDGGGLVSHAQLRKGTFAAVASQGIAVVEPQTLMLTIDELANLTDAGITVALRYDDDPTVWDSLTTGDQVGWLVRHELTTSDLTGWLGLRMPYDPTAGVLLRSTRSLVALPGVESRVPCHGLLRPVAGAVLHTSEHEQLVRLAGLRLYRDLLSLLESGPEPTVRDAAEAYAWAFCWAAFCERGDLSGTALDLARIVEARDTNGQAWGSLHTWLLTPERDRPQAPIALREVALEERVEQQGTPEEIVTRLRAALNVPGLNLFMDAGRLGTHPGRLVALDRTRSHRSQLWLQINEDHPMALRWRNGDRFATEWLLLELARTATRLARNAGHTVNLTAVQQVLLAQRLGA